MITKTSVSLLLAACSALSSYAFSWGNEEYCRLDNVKSGTCSKGEPLLVSHPLNVIKYCDLDKPVITMPMRGNSAAICFYSGKERIDKDKKS